MATDETYMPYLPNNNGSDGSYMTLISRKYDLGVYSVDSDQGQSVDEDVSAQRDEQTNVPYDSSPSVRRKFKTLTALSSLHKVATRSLSIQQTAQLTKACSIKYGETINVRFGVGEKLTIMFMYNNTYAVYRKSDGAVAILTNAQFQSNPPAMLDGSKYGYLLSEVKFLLMYAVAKTDHSIQQGLKFYQNDVILILAKCRDTYVGITARKRVGILPSKLVHIITQRRMCIFNGLLLRMTPISNVKLGDDYGSSQHHDITVQEITKSPNGLFSWVTHEGYEVSLHSLIEKALTVENTNDEKLYERIPEVSYYDTSPRKDDSSLEGEIWFHGNLSREQAENILKEDGDFLVRFMSNVPGVYVLSCKTKTGYEHFRLLLNDKFYYHTNGGDFTSIRNLILVHQNVGQPISKDPSTVIRRAVPYVIYHTYSSDATYEDYFLPSEAQVVGNEENEEPSKPLPRIPITYYDDGGDAPSMRIRVDQNEGTSVNEDSSRSIRRAVGNIINETSGQRERSEIYDDNALNDDLEATVNDEESDDEPPPEIPPKTKSRVRFVGDVEKFPLLSQRLDISTNKDSGSGRKEELDGDLNSEGAKKTEKEIINRHSVKSLIKVFSSDAGRSDGDLLYDSPPSRGGPLQEKMLSTAQEGESANDPFEKSESSSPSDEKEPKYILKMKEDISLLKSVVQSFYYDVIHPENTKQRKSPLEEANLQDKTDKTDKNIEATKGLSLSEERFETEIREEFEKKDTPERNESETENTPETREVKEEINKLKPGLQPLLTQTTIVQPQFLETYQSLPVMSTHKGVQKRIRLKKELEPFWQMEITDHLLNIVAMYFEPEFFHDFGRTLGVHRNRRTQIEGEKVDVERKTFKLLDQWHQKLGQAATIGKLIESLEPFNPEDFNFILEDFCTETESQGNYSQIS